jgi:hypothetical protein
MKELQELRNEILTLRNYGVINKEEEKSLLTKLNSVKEQFAISVVMDRLPESDYIRQQAQQMDEKEFDQWWWETVYKGN